MMPKCKRPGCEKEAERYPRYRGCCGIYCRDILEDVQEAYADCARIARELVIPVEDVLTREGKGSSDCAKYIAAKIEAAAKGETR